MAPNSEPVTSPQVSGTIAEVTAVSGDKMLIGPMARHAYSNVMAAAPVMPEMPPQTTALIDHSPGTIRVPTMSSTTPETAPRAVTRSAEMRRAARPPKKSAAP